MRDRSMDRPGASKPLTTTIRTHPVCRLGGSAQGLLTRAASRPIISSLDTSTMDRPRTPGSFLPLPDAELEILIALADGEAHGYAIMRAVAERTAGRRRLGPGTLYTALKRLLAA